MSVTELQTIKDSLSKEDQVLLLKMLVDDLTNSTNQIPRYEIATPTLATGAAQAMAKLLNETR
jgi:hypothetical protein